MGFLEKEAVLFGSTGDDGKGYLLAMGLPQTVFDVAMIVKGVFLISFKVPNVEAALAELREKGVNLIDQKPRSIMGQKFAFIDHPKDLCGLLAEVIE